MNDEEDDLSYIHFATMLGLGLFIVAVIYILGAK